MNSMAINTDKNVWVFYNCPACKQESTNAHKIIPQFYSYDHAISEGWKPTKDINFCPPGEMFVFVCPDCCEKHGLQLQS